MVMESVVIVAVCILGVIFLTSLITLTYICYNRYMRKRRSLLNEDSSSMSQTVLSFDDDVIDDASGNLELGAVITCDDGTIRQLLETEAWANDVHGVIPHCIAILKMCREVTEKLVAVAMDTKQGKIHPSHMSEIVVVAKCITPRVDDVMRSISPPIDTKLLEARSAALIYAVQHLALLVRNAWQSYDSLDWIDTAMDNMAQHMKILHNVNHYPMAVTGRAKEEDEDARERYDDTFQHTANQELSQL